MTTAYLLAREGKSVVILDKGQIGSGETGTLPQIFPMS
jgi:glycine/D-amino acid oxidase-like deaminating enzyme